MLYLPSKKALLQQVSSEFKKKIKKLVLVLATSTPVTENRKKAVETAKMAKSAEASKDREESKGKYPENFAQVLCIRYSINFGQKFISALLNSDSKINAVHLAFAKELDLPMRQIDVKAQKIDSITLDTYEMVVTAFLVKNKTNQVRFFEETFLVTNISPEVVFGMFFFILSGTDIDFLRREFR